MLKFITGNNGKYKEISEILEPIGIKRANIDLDEIQELDPYKIIRHKLNEALKHEKAGFFIEDTSTYYKAFNNKLPGTLMKWFLQVLKPIGLYKLAKKMDDTKAEMHAIIAYVDNRKKVHFFEGRTKGGIVKPRGKGGFGVDAIFKPVGSAKTFGQLKEKGSTKFSPRYKAAMKLKKYLLK